MVEKVESAESSAQPTDSGTTPPEGSQEKPNEGIVIGLKKQLAKEKEKSKSLSDRLAALESSSSDEGGHPAWAEDDLAKKELAKHQKRIRELEGANAKLAREAKIVKLSSQTGIPIEIFADVEDDFQLAEKVAEWKKDTVVESPEEAPKPSAFETGHTTPSAERNVWDMTSQEFAKYGEQLRAEANRKR